MCLVKNHTELTMALNHRKTQNVSRFEQWLVSELPNTIQFHQNPLEKKLKRSCLGPSRKDVPGLGGTAQWGQSKATFIVTMTSQGGQGGEGVKKS